MSNRGEKCEASGRLVSDYTEDQTGSRNFKCPECDRMVTLRKPLGGGGEGQLQISRHSPEEPGQSVPKKKRSEPKPMLAEEPEIIHDIDEEPVIQGPDQARGINQVKVRSKAKAKLKQTSSDAFVRKDKVGKVRLTKLEHCRERIMAILKEVEEELHKAGSNLIWVNASRNWIYLMDQAVGMEEGCKYTMVDTINEIKGAGNKNTRAA